MIKLLDTFAWVWWFHLALEQSIWKENVSCIWYSEIDKFAKQVYNERFPWIKDLWSITELDIDWLENFDLLTGWFPCQDVSVAWKQNLEWGGRTILVEYLLQILEKKQPKYFVFENVKGFMNKKFTEFRESIFERMQKAGYHIAYEILNTKDFWLPQNRERIFIVWSLIRDDIRYFLFPQWQELTIFLKDILEEEADEKYYLSEKFKEMLYKHKDRHDWKGTWFWFKPKQLTEWEYASTLRANAALCPTDNILRINNPTHSNNRVYDTNWISPTINTCWWWNRQVKILIKNATKKWYLEAEEWDWVILDNPNSKTKRSRVKKWISWTLTCAGSDWVVSKGLLLRKLTPIEYARLQWFPDTWSTDFVSNSQACKQMWNAISVTVVKNIFDNLL